MDSRKREKRGSGPRPCACPPYSKRTPIRVANRPVAINHDSGRNPMLHPSLHACTLPDATVAGCVQMEAPPNNRCANLHFTVSGIAASVGKLRERRVAALGKIFVNCFGEDIAD